MNKITLIITSILLFGAVSSYSQPKSASSAQAGAITVYTDNGYYIKAKNSDARPYRFSFKYETTGYTVSSAAWSKFPVYTPVNTTTETYEKVRIEANEERNLFTAPVANDKKTEYYIKIIEVYDVTPL